MKMLLKALLWLVVVVVVAGGALFGFAWYRSEAALATKYAISDPPLTITRDDAALARGAHLFTVMGCGECHGPAGAGHTVFADPPIGAMIAPNITPAALAGRYDADANGDANRHGVRHDGTPLMFMPSGDFQQLSDADVAALVAHVQALPPSDNAPGKAAIGPVGRVLALFGKLHLTPAADIDHAARARTAPAPAPTAEYGKYLAQACTGCHGADFGGQHVPGTPPEFPDSANLTPHPQAIGNWSVNDFGIALRAGMRPDGRKLDPFMPYAAYAAFSDDEVAAIYAYLRTLPAKAPKAK